MQSRIAVGYCRTSTPEQASTQNLHAHSINNQKEEIRRYCEYKHLELKEFYVDEGLSGKSISKRPALQQMLSELKPGMYVVCYDNSRFARNTLDALILLEKLFNLNCYLISIRENIDMSDASGKLFYTILSAFNTFQREATSENVSTNLKRLSKEGLLRSRPPFGYKMVGKDCNYEPEESQQAIIEKIKRYYYSGMNYSEIARRLNADGDNQVISLNKKNKERVYKFHAQTVRRILIDHNVVESDDKRPPLRERLKCMNVRLADKEIGSSSTFPADVKK